MTRAASLPPLAVLVVDDDPRVRASVVRLLDQTGVVTAIAVDADQAWRLSEIRTAADVAVVDVPGGGGAGLRLVSRLASTTTVVAVGLSASAGQAALGAGAVTFVEKNGDADALLTAIRLAHPGRWRDSDRCPAALDGEG